MAAMTFPLHGLIYLQDTARVGLTSAQTAPVDGFLTEHNRREAQVSLDIIGNGQRSVVGTMRKYTVATKRSISVSWENVPADYYHTLDGQIVPTSLVKVGMGGNDMLEFYKAYYNKPIYLYVLNRNALKTAGVTQANINTDLANATNVDVASQTASLGEHGDRFTVLFSEFSYNIVKRGVKMENQTAFTDFWNVNMSFEEV